MSSLIELFTNMDLAQLSFIVDTEVVHSLNVPPLDSPKSLSAASAGGGHIALFKYCTH